MSETLEYFDTQDQLELADEQVSSEDDTPLDIPVEDRRVKTENQDLLGETLYSWVQCGKINLQPEFQRNYVWDQVKASRLIEPLLLDIPIPVFHVAEEPNKTYAVVDSQQRLIGICTIL